MKKLSRDTKLAIGILVLLVLVTVFAAMQSQAQQQHPPLSSVSSAPDGALALKLWLEELGYEVDEQILTNFLPPEEVSTLLILEPQFPTEVELEALDNWVEAGGTVIAIGGQYGMYSLIDHYEFELQYLAEQNGTVTLPTPLFNSPASLDLTNVKPRVALRSERKDVTALLTYQGNPVLVSFEQEEGRVILGTIPEAFSNAGLKESGNPELILNILAMASSQGAVWFDEWHHGLRNTEQVLGPGEFLRQTPIGHAILFAALIVFLTLFIQGRGFGRPVPLPQEIKRRGAMEHITGMANLSRRAAHRSAVMLHYHQQIKRRLGQRYRLNPSLEDQEYVDVLSGYNPSIDKEALLKVLKRLKKKDIAEAEMVDLAAEASKWIDD